MLNYPLKPISDIPQPTESSGNFWLWAGIVTVFLLLLEPEKKQRKPSPTPADLHGLEGRIRSCDAWFESTDKKGRLIHRCFIYKPTCNARKCKTDPKLNERISEMQGLSGYTSLKHDVFRWKIGSKQIEVIKNPTDSEIRQISNEFHEKYPRSKESGIRSTYDQYDNKYVWGADDLHSDVEPMINMLFHVYTHQSPGMAKWLLDTGMTIKKKITLFGIKFNPDVTENQIRARVLLPKKIIKGTYFIRASTTPGVSYVMGQDRSGKVMTQSIRFDRDLFDISSA